MKRVVLTALAATMLSGTASATVVNFDSIDTRTAVVAIPTNYGGISWDSTEFGVYGTSEDPYNPNSAPNRVLTNRLTFTGAPEPISFSFATPVSFSGLYFAGYSLGAGNYSVSLGGTVLNTVSFTPSATPTFYGNSYAGAIDRVTITATRGYYVFDDVTYTALGGGVPEPATWAMMVMGFGLAGAGLRRRGKVAARVAYV